MEQPWTSTSVGEMHSLLHSCISVTTATSEHQGRVLTIDPVTHSIVLLCDDGTLDHVFGHAVTEVTIIERHCSEEMKQKMEELLTPKQQTHYSSQELAITRDRLKAWIAKNRIPVEVKGDNLVVAGGSLEISPPYDCNSCLTDNPIILQRVHKLITRMPPISTDIS